MIQLHKRSNKLVSVVGGVVGVVASVATALASGTATEERMRRVGSRRQGRRGPRECGEGGSFGGRSAAVSEVALVEASEECREAEAIFSAECERRRRISRRSAGGGGDFCGGVQEKGGDFRGGGVREAEAIFAAFAMKVALLSRHTHITSWLPAVSE